MTETPKPKTSAGRLWPRRITVGLSDKAADRAEQLARRFAVPVSMIVREAVESGLRYVPRKLQRRKRNDKGINIDTK